LGLIFSQLAGYFEDLQVACLWAYFIFMFLAFGLVLCRFLFCELLVFEILNFMENLLFHCTVKRNLGMLFCKFAYLFMLIYGLFFHICLFFCF